MRLIDFIEPELVLTNLQAHHGRLPFELLIEKICGVHISLDGEFVHECLLKREEKYPTGLEGGIAVPHALVPSLQQPICLVARLQKPIDYATMDGSLVHTIFLLLSPLESLTTHLRILARIARLCSLPDMREAMLKAKDARDLYETIQSEDRLV